MLPRPVQSRDTNTVSNVSNSSQITSISANHHPTASNNKHQHNHTSSNLSTRYQSVPTPYTTNLIDTETTPPRVMILILSLLLLISPKVADGMALANKDVSVSQLLRTHAADIQALKEIATSKISDFTGTAMANDVFFLRHCLDHPDDMSAQQEQLRQSLEWRLGAGHSICSAAAKAVEKAGVSSWDNEPVLSAAPHSSAIGQYITPSNCITSTSSQNDLVYCIRAGQIDDKSLMSSVSISQMVDFFLYAKEVNNLVVNQRSLATDRLLGVMTANDLSGIQLVGGSADFRKALSESSKQASMVYPESTQGPTLLLNLPPLLNALVKVFTPLFPPVVKERLRFAQGPLAKVTDLTQVSSEGSVERTEFLRQLDELVYL